VQLIVGSMPQGGIAAAVPAATSFRALSGFERRTGVLLTQKRAVAARLRLHIRDISARFARRGRPTRDAATEAVGTNHLRAAVYL
jgi:hypothetical protein